MFYVYGLFKPSLVLEMGINALAKEGFTGEKLLVVALEPGRPERQWLLDTMYSSDGMSLLDGVAIMASVGMVLGVIYGSVVYIGPVATGLLGMAGGGGLGYLLDRKIRPKNKARYAAPAGEIIVAARCGDQEEAARAESLMREYRAVALGRAPVSGGATGKSQIIFKEQPT